IKHTTPLPDQERDKFMSNKQKCDIRKTMKHMNSRQIPHQLKKSKAKTALMIKLKQPNIK
ncbi:hypothetical protein NQU36_28140, partial [Escherichia coli]|uniref:hypothetical protein n=1 Tax=Escherichia coli TaxID=562 RepID=UPI002117FE81